MRIEKMRIGIVVLLFLSVLLISQSLSAQDYHRQYQTGKNFFAEEKYGLAMEVFKSLMVYDKENSYSEYASYYYAVSAYNQKFPAVAKDMFLQIKQLYPSWEKMNEVNYWLAKIYFDQQQYFQAMNLLRGRLSGTLSEDIDGMKSHYLNQIEDIEILKMMWEEHPADPVVGEVLAKTIASKPFLEQDSNLMDSVLAHFNLDRTAYASTIKPATVFKDKYTVSLLFPFLANSLNPTPGIKVNQSVLDLYQGMRMAIDTLVAEDIHIELRAYDTERSAATTLEVLKLDELKSSDLLVGPLFNSQLDLVREFSINNRINMINPVSSNFEFAGENPFGLLYLPDYETIGIKSAEWLAAQLSNKNCMVFFGDVPKDSVTAYGFTKRAEELGLNLVWVEEVNVKNSAKIFDKLATPIKYDEFKNPIEFKLKLDSIGGIFVASDNALIYTKIISGVETRGNSIIVMGNQSWLDNAAANFTTYERLHITMAAPNFIKQENAIYRAFRKTFIKAHGKAPTKYSGMGFEFMMFVGRSLSRYGTYFQEGPGIGELMPGYMSEGFDFQSGRANQFVPFIHFSDGELEVLNSKGRD